MTRSKYTPSGRSSGTSARVYTGRINRAPRRVVSYSWLTVRADFDVPRMALFSWP